MYQNAYQCILGYYIEYVLLLHISLYALDLICIK